MAISQLEAIERDNREFRSDVNNQLAALQMLIANVTTELRRTNGAIERTFDEVADLKKKSTA